MKNYLFHAGIDISKDKLDISILDSSTLRSQHLIIKNDMKSISDFVKILKQKIDIIILFFVVRILEYIRIIYLLFY